MYFNTILLKFKIFNDVVLLSKIVELLDVTNTLVRLDEPPYLNKHVLEYDPSDIEIALYVPLLAKAAISANNTPSESLKSSLVPAPLAVSAARVTVEPCVGM